MEGEETSPPIQKGILQVEEQQHVKKKPNFFKRVVNNITIEPAMFIIAFAAHIDDLASSQMIILKSCLTDFQYNETVCYNITDSQWKEQKDEISVALTDFNFYKTVATSFVPCFMAFYLGAWMDLFGRKPIMYLFLITTAMQQAIIVVCAYFFESSKWYILLSHIPTSFGGGHAAWHLAISAFIADITTPEERAFRFGMLTLVARLGTPLAAQAGKYLLETGGYVCVFSTTLTGIVLGGILLVWRLKRFDWNPPKKSKEQRKSFSPLVIKDVFVSTLKRRPGKQRKYILVLILISIFTIMPFMGEHVVAYSYTLIRYNWRVNENSDYSSITSIVDLVAQATFIPLMGYLKLNEAWVMTILYTTISARHTLKAFSYESWMYYLASFIDCVGFYCMFIRSSMLSTIVAKDELGKVMAFTSAFDSILPIGISALYKNVFDVSMKSQ